jgi:hypothetical protein
MFWKLSRFIVRDDFFSCPDKLHNIIPLGFRHGLQLANDDPRVPSERLDLTSKVLVHSDYDGYNDKYN